MDEADLKLFENKKIQRIEQTSNGLIFHFTDKGVYEIAFETLGLPVYSALEVLRESEKQRKLVPIKHKVNYFGEILIEGTEKYKKYMNGDL